MGEAAGICAALAVAGDCLPHEVAAEDVRAKMNYPGPSIEAISNTRQES
jgi:hypothetical protein